MKYRIYHASFSTTCVVPDGTAVSEIRKLVLEDIQKRTEMNPNYFIHDAGLVVDNVERG